MWVGRPLRAYCSRALPTAAMIDCQSPAALIVAEVGQAAGGGDGLDAPVCDGGGRWVQAAGADTHGREPVRVDLVVAGEERDGVLDVLDLGGASGASGVSVAALMTPEDHCPL